MNNGESSWNFWNDELSILHGWNKIRLNDSNMEIQNPWDDLTSDFNLLWFTTWWCMVTYGDVRMTNAPRIKRRDMSNICKEHDSTRITQYFCNSFIFSCHSGDRPTSFVYRHAWCGSSTGLFALPGEFTSVSSWAVQVSTSWHYGMNPNRGFLKWGYPYRSSIFPRFPFINHLFWGTSIYGTPHIVRRYCPPKPLPISCPPARRSSAADYDLKWGKQMRDSLAAHEFPGLNPACTYLCGMLKSWTRIGMEFPVHLYGWRDPSETPATLSSGNVSHLLGPQIRTRIGGIGGTNRSQNLPCLMVKTEKQKQPRIFQWRCFP